MEVPQAAWWFAYAKTDKHETASDFRDHMTEFLATGRKIQRAEDLRDVFDSWIKGHI